MNLKKLENDSDRSHTCATCTLYPTRNITTLGHISLSLSLSPLSLSLSPLCFSVSSSCVSLSSLSPVCLLLSLAVFSLFLSLSLSHSVTLSRRAGSNHRNPCIYSSKLKPKPWFPIPLSPDSPVCRLLGLAETGRGRCGTVSDHCKAGLLYTYFIVNQSPHN